MILCPFGTKGTEHKKMLSIAFPLLCLLNQILFMLIALSLGCSGVTKITKTQINFYRRQIACKELYPLLPYLNRRLAPRQGL
jgi:hypothetical protein